jgi:predicted RNase H-like HicB family nuclease/predicted RNA binding protein YcfA (HicA-like mRNA interferase family)
VPPLETNTRKIVSRLKREGWTLIHGGKHDKFEHPDKPGVLIVVPVTSKYLAGSRKTPSKKQGGSRSVAVTYYVGILDGAKGVWGVRIPDVPGCYGGGATPEAAIADTISALREVAAHWATKGVHLEPPRSMQDVIEDKGVEFNAAAGESLVMIPLILDRGRPVKANISLDAGLLEAIDQESARRGLTRSSFLASAALDKIESQVPTRATHQPRTRKRSQGRSKSERKERAE